MLLFLLLPSLLLTDEKALAAEPATFETKFAIFCFLLLPLFDVVLVLEEEDEDDIEAVIAAPPDGNDDGGHVLCLLIDFDAACRK